MNLLNFQIKLLIVKLDVIKFKQVTLLLVILRAVLRLCII